MECCGRSQAGVNQIVSTTLVADPQLIRAEIDKRGKKAKNCARVAAARVLLELVYYGLRDGRIRRLESQVAA